MTGAFAEEKDRNTTFILLILSLITLLIHFFTNYFTQFGIFRDELYYIACSRRPAMGYVDQPPLSIFLLGLSRLTFGDSLFSIRILPALSGALSVFITGLTVRRLGGGRYAVVLSAVSYIAAPIFLAMNNIYSMNAIDILLWTLAFYILILILGRDTEGKNARYWIWLGIVLGLGLMNKISMMWFGGGLFLALLTRQYRHYLKTPRPYIAALTAFILFLPFIVWNITHSLAHLEFMRNASGLKYSSVTPVDFISGQLLMLLPISIPVWASGIYYFFFSEKGKKFRAAGIIYAATIAILIINWHSKPEYAAPSYPVLFAGGSLFIEEFLRKRAITWLKYALPFLIVLFGILLAPFVIPCLPVKAYIAYSKMTGFQPDGHEGKEVSELPQLYADMFGWEDMAKTVSEVYLLLPQEERKNAFVFAQNYGEASALEYYSKKYPIPRVISPHNSFWVWEWEELKDTTKENSYQTAIIIGGQVEDHLKALEIATQKGTIKSRYAMPYENNLPVFIGKGFKIPLEVIWRSEKHFI
ncbi:MAG: glycosyltransferase family 39 protein [Ignavibacteria bacterium]|jgi:4-amino-4-deoxy-L-arabinose transferase-like glycosyltransferase|nr:glycosyltransferase family 39 protein [Ignavibacteria bacterium]